MDATMTIRMGDAEKQLVADFARTFGMSTSEWARRTLLEAIEDAVDARIADEAYEEYLAVPVSYTLDEVAAELGDA